MDSSDLFMSISEHNEALDEVMDALLAIKHDSRTIDYDDYEYYIDCRHHYLSINQRPTAEEYREAISSILVGIKSLKKLLWIRRNCDKQTQ